MQIHKTDLNKVFKISSPHVSDAHVSAFNDHGIVLCDIKFVVRSSDLNIAQLPSDRSTSRGRMHLTVCLSRRRTYPEQQPKLEPHRISRRTL